MKIVNLRDLPGYVRRMIAAEQEWEPGAKGDLLPLRTAVKLYVRRALQADPVEEDFVDEIVGILSCAQEADSPQQRWHHPSTDKTGHLSSECEARGCHRPRNERPLIMERKLALNLIDGLRRGTMGKLATAQRLEALL